MLKERLQILVDSEQRRRLDLEARRRGVSIGAVVREAIDARLASPDAAQKRRAIEEMRAAPRVPHHAPDELNRITELAIADASGLAPATEDSRG